MKCALVTMQDQGYRYLTQYTWDQNQLPYCNKHQYPYHIIDLDANRGEMNPGFIKIWTLLELCKSNPDLDWLLWIDGDALITNHTIKIEDVADNKFHFILATWFNEINNGVCMVRNSPEGRSYLEYIFSLQPKYNNHGWVEQQAMIDSFYRFKDIIKIVPQRTLNAACYSDGCHTDRTTDLDRLGTDGQWQPGDWIMHWPGQHPQMRVALAQKYLQQVIV